MLPDYVKHFPKHSQKIFLSTRKQIILDLKKTAIYKCDSSETTQIIDYVFVWGLFSPGPVIDVHHTT